MMGKDIITMKNTELQQLHIIRKVLDKRMTQQEAAELLDMSSRQIRRKQKRVREEGSEGIIHRKRGKPSSNRKPEKDKQKVIKLYREKYWDFGPTFASEKIFELDEIELSRETLRQWLLDSGDWKRCRKGRKHRQWRDRRPRYGELVQADGSHHDWFEGRAEKCVLMGYIDDATSRTYARFYEYEGTKPAMDSFKKYIEKNGIPQSIYMDRHPTYKSTKKPTIEEQLANKKAMSQFERAVEELGVRFIHAQSAPAKGRIERLFKTFQDRLIKELRLAGVSSIEEGNKFLEVYSPKHNEKFGVEAKDPVDLHRPAGDMDLDSVLCIKEKRVLRNDYTVLYGSEFYQILDRTTAKKVIVEEHVSGKVFISYNGNKLRYKKIAKLPKKEKLKVKKIHKGKARTPAKDHPWKKWTGRSYPQNPQYQQKEKRSKKEKELLLVY
jgi:hypothetical protein